MTAPGSALPLNTTCPTATSRLRALSMTAAVTTATTTTTTTTPVVAPTTYPYQVCAVPSVLSNTNVPSSRRLRNLSGITGLQSTMTNTLVANLKDSATLQKTLALATPVRVSAVGVVTDSTAPALDNTATATQNVWVNTPVPTATPNGAFSLTFNFTSATLPLSQMYQCYYQIISGTTAPTDASQIRACTSTTNCGAFAIGNNYKSTNPVTVISNTMSPAFVIGTTYSLFASCYNQVPNASLNWTGLLYSYTPTCPSTQTVSNGACVTPTPPVTPTPATTTSTINGNNLLVSLFSLIMIIFLLN